MRNMVELTKILKDEAWLEAEKRDRKFPFLMNWFLIGQLKFGRKKMQKMKIKMWMIFIQFKFNYFNKLYINNLNLFSDIEKNQLKTIKNSFDFNYYRTKKIEKIIKEYNLFKTKIIYRLSQKA